MLLTPTNDIVFTNDGLAVLRELDLVSPAAKNLIEISRAQDEEVGDGTTSVVILAGEILALALPQLERHIHPIHVIAAYKHALADALSIIEDISIPVDVSKDKQVYPLIESSISTKISARQSELWCKIALQAVRTVYQKTGDHTTIDIKRYARVEKIPGAQLEDSRVLDGIMLNKDIVHPSMRRRINNPRIVLLDCPLEYKKGESQTNIELSGDNDFNRILAIEEEEVRRMCDSILAVKPDLVITEKGISDLAQHFLVKKNVSCIRRVKKTDSNRISRCTGATVVNRVDDLQESDVGTNCGLFEVDKMGTDEYFTFLTHCKEPKACTILLRGPSKDILNEIERNLGDAMNVARNIMMSPRISPGGGATEAAISQRLFQMSKNIAGVEQWPYRALAEAMEVIPRTLAQNSGANPIRALTKLRAKQAEGGSTWGIDGETGEVVDMRELGVWEPQEVKKQSLKTAVECACLLLRVDEICPAKSGRQGGGGGGAGMAGMEG
ncbi:MAG: hypothetical protein Q9227_006878 [Pyrenula ochraceoflavens]